MVGGVTTDAVDLSLAGAKGAKSAKSAKGEKSSGSVGQLRDTAGRIVGSVFYGTMMKAMRETGMKGKYGHGGRGEEAFSAQLHQMFAENMGAAAHLPLSDAIVKAYERQATNVRT